MSFIKLFLESIKNIEHRTAQGLESTNQAERQMSAEIQQEIRQLKLKIQDYSESLKRWRS